MGSFKRTIEMRRRCWTTELILHGPGTLQPASAAAVLMFERERYTMIDTLQRRVKTTAWVTLGLSTWACSRWLGAVTFPFGHVS